MNGYVVNLKILALYLEPPMIPVENKNLRRGIVIWVIAMQDNFTSDTASNS